MMRNRKKLVALAVFLVSAWAYGQERVGEALYVSGVSTAQKPGEAPRFLGKGDSLSQGDVLTTGTHGFAVIGLQDGTKMTLRPNTSLAVEDFSMKQGQENLLMRLVRGGLRAITGSIGKSRPDAIKINTVTATIGIRGTEFDARLCGADCRAEAGRSRPAPPTPEAERVVARLAQSSGAVSAGGSGGQVRPLSPGASLFNGEVVRTAPGAYGVLAFRDQSKVTVVENSEMKLEDVHFAPAQPDSGSFIIKLVRGGLRAVTGLLGKRNPSAVQFQTVVATIGIRGTGVDMRMASHCVDAGGGGGKPARGRGGSKGKAAKSCSDSAFAYTWDGAVVLGAGGKDVLVIKDKSAVFNPLRGAPELLAVIPGFFLDERAPRPDTVEVDFDKLFGATGLHDIPDGLYVGLRRGHIHFGAAGGAVDLGPWETGVLVDGSTIPVRAAENFGFLFNDPYPTPDDASDKTFRLLELLSPGGEAGRGICEIYK